MPSMQVAAVLRVVLHCALLPAVYAQHGAKGAACVSQANQATNHAPHPLHTGQVTCPVTTAAPTVLRILVGVFAIAADTDARQAVRETWMTNPKVCSAWSLAEACQVAVVFVLGSPHGAGVRQEMKTHGDLFLLPNPENMNTGKSFEWLQSAHAAFPTGFALFGKSDLDTYIHVDALLEQLGQVGDTETLYFGAQNQWHSCGKAAWCPTSWGYMSGQSYYIGARLVAWLANQSLTLRPSETVGHEDLAVAAKLRWAPLPLLFLACPRPAPGWRSCPFQHSLKTAAAIRCYHELVQSGDVTRYRKIPIRDGPGPPWIGSDPWEDAARVPCYDGIAPVERASCASDVTIVSGFWNVTGKYGAGGHYFTWMANALRIEAPMVFFYEDYAVKAYVQGVRSDVGADTHFVYHAHAGFSVRRLYRTGWVHPQHVPSAELGMVWLEKTHLVKHAADINPFSSCWVTWYDAGLVNYRDVPPAPGPWPAKGWTDVLPRDTIIYSHVEESYHHMSGGAFMYNLPVASKVHDLFERALLTCAETIDDWRCGSDQFLFSMLIDNFPSAFYRIANGYGQLVPALSTPLSDGATS